MVKFFYVLLCAFFVFSCNPSSNPDNGTNDNDHDSHVDRDTEIDDCEDCGHDPCNPNPCEDEPASDGICIATGFMEYECGCVGDCHWDGRECNCDVVESYPCDPNPCKDAENSDGTCIPISWAEYECGCVGDCHWDGTRCDCDVVESYPCDPNPCIEVAHSDGICYDTSFSTYDCGCIENYFWNGDECESPCDPNPCADNAGSDTACFATDLTAYECREPQVPVRIVAGNLTTGSQSYDNGEGIRILKALKPDIALVQEMNYKNNSENDYKNFAQQIVGTNYYVVENPAKYNIPNGIVSKYPIKETGSWDDPNLSDRELKWAVIDIPGDIDIFALSVHLKSGNSGKQSAAAKVIVDEIAKVKASDPGKYYYVVGGDFNGPTTVSSDGFGRNKTFYVADPDPVDENGNGCTNANRSSQYDFVLADYPLHEFQVPTVYYSSEDSTKTKIYENGLVFDTSLYSQSVLDEYFSPAQKGDSNGSQMQHMAVVKDFLIELK